MMSSRRNLTESLRWLKQSNSMLERSYLDIILLTWESRMEGLRKDWLSFLEMNFGKGLSF
jgi:hypothetical protein